MPIWNSTTPRQTQSHSDARHQTLLSKCVFEFGNHITVAVLCTSASSFLNSSLVPNLASAICFFTRQVVKPDQKTSDDEVPVKIDDRNNHHLLSTIFFKSSTFQFTNSLRLDNDAATRLKNEYLLVGLESRTNRNNKTLYFSRCLRHLEIKFVHAISNDQENIATFSLGDLIISSPECKYSSLQSFQITINHQVSGIMFNQEKSCHNKPDFEKFLGLESLWKTNNSSSSPWFPALQSFQLILEHKTPGNFYESQTDSDNGCFNSSFFEALSKINSGRLHHSLRTITLGGGATNPDTQLAWDHLAFQEMWDGRSDEDDDNSRCSRWKNLANLTISHFGLYAEDVVSLARAKLTALRYLTIHQDGEIVVEAATMPPKVQKPTATHINALIQSLPKLVGLRLSFTSILNDDDVIHIGQSCRDLRSLELQGCFKIRGSFLKAKTTSANDQESQLLFGALEKLVVVESELSDLAILENESTDFDFLSENFPCLTTLHLGGVNSEKNNFDASSLACPSGNINNNNTNLTSLTLTNCKINVETLNAICSRFSSTLSEFGMHSCHPLQLPEGLLELHQLTKLRKLDLQQIVGGLEEYDSMIPLCGGDADDETKNKIVFPNLTELNFGRNNYQSCRAVRQVISLLPELKVLHYNGHDPYDEVQEHLQRQYWWLSLFGGFDNYMDREEYEIVWAENEKRNAQKAGEK